MRQLPWKYGLGLVLLPAAVVLATLLWVCSGRGGKRITESKDEGTKRLKQRVSVEFPIPESVVGFVIGRRGMRVRQVEDDTGAHIKFKDVQASGGKIVVISGKQECVTAAEQIIRKTVEDQLQVESNRQQVTLDIPSFAIGRLIGKQGSNIRRLQQESGARVTVVDGDDSDGVRQCVVSGSKETVSLALTLITNSIKESEKRVRNPKPPVLRRLKLYNISDDYFTVFVSAVNTQGQVWLQLLEKFDPNDLETLVAAMTEAYSKQTPHTPLSNVDVGTVCAAPFEHDTKWYRAEVTGISPEGMLNLLYVDYGDEGSMEKSMVKPLRSEFACLPTQAVCCSLHGIQPKGSVWSEEAISALEELSQCACWKPLMARLVDRNTVPPSVELVDTTSDQDVNVAEEMVSLGHVIRTPHDHSHGNGTKVTFVPNGTHTSNGTLS